MQRDPFDAAVRGEVSGYPGHVRPLAFWKPNMLDESDVTARANRLLGAGLVAWEALWCDGADRSAVYLLEPTGAGREWRQRIAEREQRSAERRAARGGDS